MQYAEYRPAFEKHRPRPRPRGIFPFPLDRCLTGSQISLRAAAARFGVSVLLKVAKEWRGGDGELFSPALFGSVERFWEFLNLASVVDRVSSLPHTSGA